MSKNNAIRTVSFMILITFFSKVLGMLRDILLASKYGTGQEATAFLTASRIPMLFFDLSLGVAIASTFIPIFNEYLEKQNKRDAILFSNNFLNIILLLCSGIALFGIIFAEALVHLIAGGLDQNTFLLTVQLLRIMFPMIIFTGSAFTIVGILQSFGEFNIPSLISLISNVIVMIYLIFFNTTFGVYGLAAAVVIGWVFQLVVQIPPLLKKGYKYQMMLNFKHPGIKKAALLILPILISAWVQPINTMVNIRLASYLNQGQAVAALDYANKLYMIVIGVFTLSIVNLIFPSLSRMKDLKHRNEFIGTINQALRVVIYILSPILVLFILLRVPLIAFVYERGEFSAYSTQLTSTALMYYTFGMIAWGTQEILNKAFYALHDATTPMKISIFGIILNVALSFILVGPMGIGGLALATAISTGVIACILTWILDRKIGGIVNIRLLSYILKIVASALSMGIIVLFTGKGVSNILAIENTMSRFVLLSLTSGVGFAIYFMVTVALGVEEAKQFVRIVKGKLRRGENG